MGYIDIISASLLAILSLALLFYFVRIVFSSITFDLRGFANRMRLQRKEKTLAGADLAIEAGELERARALLRDAFFLGGEFESFGFLDKVNNHNLEILGRILTLTESHASHFNNLPIVEGLLQSRLELYRSLIEAAQTKAKLKERQKTKGKEAPDWACGEFARKVAEIRDRLESNRKSLESQLDELFADFKKIAPANHITYH